MDSRIRIMIYIYSQNVSWEDYLKESEKIDALTKADIIKVANHYLNDNYLYFKKKTGHYPKDAVSKPNFKPIVPPNRNALSAYAKQINQVVHATPAASVSLLDIEKDATQIPLTAHVNLYYKENPINNIFRTYFLLSLRNR